MRDLSELFPGQSVWFEKMWIQQAWQKLDSDANKVDDPQERLTLLNAVNRWRKTMGLPPMAYSEAFPLETTPPHDAPTGL